jgi:hypothetical protein
MGITTTGRWTTTRRTPLRLAASAVLGPWLAAAAGRAPGVAFAASAGQDDGASASGHAPGAGWRRVETASAAGARPSPRRDHSLTFDPDRKRLYLFGGRSRGQHIGELWELDPATGAWTELPAGDGPRPAPRFGHNAFYDRAQRRLVVSMGQAGPTFFDDVWAYDPGGGAWTELGAHSGERPRPRYGAGVAYDPARHRIFVTHGFTDGGRFDDTWQFDLAGETWQRIATSGPLPEKRCLTRATWHPATAQLLLFGGQSDRQPYLGDLWALDVAGGAWAQHPSAPQPGPRHFYSADLVEASGVWYLFGGDTPGGPVGDTWAYDAAARSWSLVHEPGASEAPPPRLSADAAAVDGGLCLFGGTTKTADLDDTWLLTLVHDHAEQPMARRATQGNDDSFS